MEVRPEGELKAGFTEVAAVWKLRPKVSGGQTSLLRRRGVFIPVQFSVGPFLLMSNW